MVLVGGDDRQTTKGSDGMNKMTDNVHSAVWRVTGSVCLCGVVVI